MNVKLFIPDWGEQPWVYKLQYTQISLDPFNLTPLRISSVFLLLFMHMKDLVNRKVASWTRSPRTISPFKEKILAVHVIENHLVFWGFMKSVGLF